MELFDKLGDTIVSVSKDATQKAKDLSDLARLRMEMRAKKDYINKLYQEIGKLYYELHKDDENKEFDDHMQLVKEALDSLEELNRQAGQIKGTVRCENCSQYMPVEADFRSKCGAKLVKPQAEEFKMDDEEEEFGNIADTEAFEEEKTVSFEEKSDLSETVATVEETTAIDEN